MLMKMGMIGKRKEGLCQSHPPLLTTPLTTHHIMDDDVFFFFFYLFFCRMSCHTNSPMCVSSSDKTLDCYMSEHAIKP